MIPIRPADIPRSYPRFIGFAATLSLQVANANELALEVAVVYGAIPTEDRHPGPRPGYSRLSPSGVPAISCSFVCNLLVGYRSF